MSIDTQVVLEAAGPRNAIERLADALTVSCPSPLARATEIWGDAWRPKAWRIDDGRLKGPGGWSLTPRRHTVEIYHMLRSSVLAPDHAYGAVVIDGVNFFGNALNSPSAIFTHELLLVPDLPIAESARALSKEIAPAKGWSDLNHAHFEDGCWLLTSLPVKTCMREVESG